MTDVDGITLVDGNWPSDGPCTPESLISADQAIAQPFHCLALATSGDVAVPNILDAHPMFGALMAVTHSNQHIRSPAEIVDIWVTYG